MIHRCRLIDNRGEIVEGRVLSDARSTWFRSAPPPAMQENGSTFELDYVTQSGVAVYLEVER